MYNFLHLVSLDGQVSLSIKSRAFVTDENATTRGESDSKADRYSGLPDRGGSMFGFSSFGNLSKSSRGIMALVRSVW